MKTTKLLALLLVTVLALSACTKTALRKDLMEYVMFQDTINDRVLSVHGQSLRLLLGIHTPFEQHKGILLDSTIEVLEEWRAFKIGNKKIQNLIDLKVQEWELRYAAYEKADETMLVGNYSTWEEFTSQAVEIYQRDFQRVLDKYDSLVDISFLAIQEEHGEAYSTFLEQTDLRNSREWRELRGG